MREINFDWFDTELQKRLDIVLYFVVFVVLFLTAVLILTGLFTEGWIVIGAIIGIGAICLAYYCGSVVLLRKNPTTVGLSADRIRLLYSYGQHRDILWDDIDDILVQGSRPSFRIVHRNGGFTTLWAPVKIADLVKKMLQEVRRKNVGL